MKLQQHDEFLMCHYIKKTLHRNDYVKKQQQKKPWFYIELIPKELSAGHAIHTHCLFLISVVLLLVITCMPIFKIFSKGTLSRICNTHIVIVCS